MRAEWGKGEGERGHTLCCLCLCLCLCLLSYTSAFDHFFFFFLPPFSHPRSDEMTVTRACEVVGGLAGRAGGLLAFFFHFAQVLLCRLASR